jgi:hypothetical protein
VHTIEESNGHDLAARHPVADFDDDDRIVGVSSGKAEYVAS